MKRASSSHPLSYISTLVLQAVYWAEGLPNSPQFPATQCHRGWMEVCVGPKASQISCCDKGGSLRGHWHPAATTPMCHAIVLCFHFQKELTQNVIQTEFIVIDSLNEISTGSSGPWIIVDEEDCSVVVVFASGCVICVIYGRPVLRQSSGPNEPINQLNWTTAWPAQCQSLKHMSNIASVMLAWLSLN